MRGFTLAELIVVMGIIIIILAMAIPAFNYITGARSIESAENQISALLGRARDESIAQRHPAGPRGLALFVDAANSRPTLVMIRQHSQTGEIDLVPGAEFRTLSVGVGAKLIYNPAEPADPLYVPEDEFIPDGKRFGVILFDTRGRLIHDNYTVRGDSDLGQLGGLDELEDEQGKSQFGFLLYEREPYENQFEPDRDAWLTQNALPLLINRYNGRLLRGE